MNLLEAVKESGLDVEKIDIAGTSEEYGNYDTGKSGNYKSEGDQLVLDESSPLNPSSIYGTSKVAADFLGQNYYEAYNIPVVVTRMFNNFGPRQDSSFITGTVITQAIENDRVELGNLEPERDMCYISDGVRGHIHAALRGKPGEVYVFGRGETVSMKEWAEKILSIGQKQGYWQDVKIVQSEERYRPGNSDVDKLCADQTKLENLTGWKPRVSLEQGIEETIDWYSSK